MQYFVLNLINKLFQALFNVKLVLAFLNLAQ